METRSTASCTASCMPSSKAKKAAGCNKPEHDRYVQQECCAFLARGGVRLCCGEGLLCPAPETSRACAACTYTHGMRAPLRTSLRTSQALATRSSLRPHRPASAEGVVVSGGQSRSGWTAGRAGLGELRFRSRVAPGRRVPARGALTSALHAERGELAQKEEKVQAGWVHNTAYSHKVRLGWG